MMRSKRSRWLSGIGAMVLGVLLMAGYEAGVLPATADDGEKQGNRLHRMVVEKLDAILAAITGVGSDHSALQAEHAAQTTSHGTLQTEHATQNTAHGTLQTEHGVQNAAHGTLQNEHATQNTAHQTLSDKVDALQAAVNALSSGGGEGNHTLRWDQNLPAADRFLAAFANAAVLDKETGLVWEQSPATTTHDWHNARFQCTNRTTGGRKGWRLPSVHELASLVDPSVAFPGLA